MKKFFPFLIAIFFLLNYSPLLSQEVGINSDGSAPNSSSMLDIESTTKGILIPRMTKDQRSSISNPATGLLVFQSDNTIGFYYYNGSSWKKLYGGDGICLDNDLDGYDQCDILHPYDTDGLVADCNDQDININPGVDEICNGIDDDCDGVIDEGFSQLGQPCYAGTGACARSGFLVCSADGTYLECDVSPGDPSPQEICNGIDDDCDGVIDEGFEQLGTPCTVGAGACERSGFLVCSADGTYLECDVSPGDPSPQELCNGIDDDCDGVVDEGFELLGSPCTVGVGACQRYGFFVCSANGTSLECSAVPGNPSPQELCNGIDDDCDGLIDEGAINMVQFYWDDDQDGWGDETISTYDCQLPDGYSIFYGDCNDQNEDIYPGAIEICDDEVDNNCNGLTDEEDPDCP